MKSSVNLCAAEPRHRKLEYEQSLAHAAKIMESLEVMKCEKRCMDDSDRENSYMDDSDSENSDIAPGKNLVEQKLFVENKSMEESKSLGASLPKLQATSLPKVKPAFSEVINGQTSAGCWTASSHNILSNCIIGDSIEDDKVRAALASITLTDGCDMESVYLTLLALFILEEAFYEHEDEWMVIARNAKKWLTEVGVPKPASLARNF